MVCVSLHKKMKTTSGGLLDVEQTEYIFALSETSRLNESSQNEKQTSVMVMVIICGRTPVKRTVTPAKPKFSLLLGSYACSNSNQSVKSI